MIGVLAIMAIIASAIIPNVAQEITRAMAAAEDTSLTSISNALVRSATDNHALPSVVAAQWSAAVSSYITIPLNEISTNKGSGSRRLISRPTNGLLGVPYNQSARFAAGVAPQGTLPTVAPLQARMLLVSNLNTAVAGGAINDAQFDAIWDQAGVIPNGFTVNEKLRISRISFANEFYPVTVNCTSIAGVPRWSLDAAAAKTVVIGAFTVYLMTGTRINLFIGAVAAGTLVVTKPLGITYDGVTWK
jgi:hypothetical protein